ncbi:site-specific integrase [Orbus wheelerorum]|uniref:site-specific integrase n=1 Tax=Orbus wheelerorum TaxID=3074111 RepID=UPI00370D4989
MMNKNEPALSSIYYQPTIKYYVFLYLRNSVYYIRLKQDNKNSSLSLKTTKRHIATRFFTIIKHELTLIVNESPDVSYEQLVTYFKATVSNEFYHLDNNQLNDSALLKIISSKSINTTNDKSLSVITLCNDYIQEKGTNWKYATQLSSQANKALLIEIFDYLKLDDVNKITRKDMLKVRGVIKLLPVNRKQRFKNFSLKDVLRHEYSQTIATRTINGHLIFLSSVFNWAEKNDIIKKNLATDLLLKDEQKESDKRNAFSIKQIEQLLSSCKAHYVKNGLAWQYYIPLLSAITGARLNEISQLQVKDIIRLENGLIYIDINEDGIEGKSLKNQYSARYVPLVNNAFGFNYHEFMNYVESRGDKNNLLFEVTWTDKGRYSDKVSKWFNRTLLKQTLNSPKGLSFHSFRHSLATLLKSTGTPLSTAQQILGHSSQSITYDTYGKSAHVKILSHALRQALQPYCEYG